jgi:hypothetical protein
LETGGREMWYEEKHNAQTYQVFGKNREEKRLFVRFRQRWEDNIKIDLNEI